jgi:hypothetical protein
MLVEGKLHFYFYSYSQLRIALSFRWNIELQIFKNMEMGNSFGILGEGLKAAGLLGQG